MKLRDRKHEDHLTAHCFFKQTNSLIWKKETIWHISPHQTKYVRHLSVDTNIYIYLPQAKYLDKN